MSLAKPIIALLSKEYHMRQATQRPNVAQVGFNIGGFDGLSIRFEGQAPRCIR